MIHSLVLTCCVFLLLGQQASSKECAKGGDDIPAGTNDVLYFTHIPKAGGRAVSYWLGSTYGANGVFEESRPASIFASVAKQLRAENVKEKKDRDQDPNEPPREGRAKRHVLAADDDVPPPAPPRKGETPAPPRKERDRLKGLGGGGKAGAKPGPGETGRTSKDFEGVHTAFSHDRPDIANPVLVAQDPDVNIYLMTFLRDVHSHRVSMVEKYVTSVLTKTIKKKSGTKKNRKLKYKDWVYLDGPNVNWKLQTYSQPQTGAQLIGVKNLGLNGARSYQLKWVARGRNVDKAECGGNNQIDTETCSDDNLLEQGKKALQEDYAFFGLLDRFEDSVCLLHYHTRQAIPKGEPKRCSVNFRSFCLRTNTCVSDFVCPPENAEANIHQYKNQDWRETEALINLVEEPELKFMTWAEAEFEKRFQAAKADVKCQIAAGAISSKDKWLTGCWGVTQI